MFVYTPLLCYFVLLFCALLFVSLTFAPSISFSLFVFVYYCVGGCVWSYLARAVFGKNYLLLFFNI